MAGNLRTRWYGFKRTRLRSRSVAEVATSRSRGDQRNRYEKHRGPTEAGKQYAAAHAAHYTTKNLHKALELYRGVVAAHPNTQDAVYSHAQIQNIVKA